MKRKLLLSISIILALCMLPAQSGFANNTSIAAAGLQSVLTEHNDIQRSGANLNEAILNTGNVRPGSFGKLYSLPVDGHIYAQPLVVTGINIPNKGVRDVLYVATEHNSVYAFDADARIAAAPFWQVNLGPSAPVPADFGNGNGTFGDIQVEVGITSTPVIDPATQTLYVVAFTKDAADVNKVCSPAVKCTYHHNLHALDLATGAEKFGGPTLISGSVPGTGVGGNGSTVTFDSHQQLQRSALLLFNGVVYFASGGYGDTDPYHGWLFGYNAATLQRVAIFCTTPNAPKTASDPHAGEGGVWMGGVGASVDADGKLYIVSGNGSFDANTAGGDYADTVIKLDPTGVSGGLLPVIDWFTPYDQAIISAADNDLGSTGAMFIPGTNDLIAGGKAGVLYLIDRNNLGHYNGPAGPDHVLQRFQATTTSFYTSPVLWNGPQGIMLYYWEINDVLKQLHFNGTTFDVTPVAKNAIFLSDPGGALSISANGAAPGSAILWGSIPTSSADHTIATGVLYAYNAADVSQKLWDSTLNPNDAVGNHVKYNAPTVANGKVYLGTDSDQLDVYGLFLQTGSGPAQLYLPLVNRQ